MVTVKWRGRVAKRLLELKENGCKAFLPLIDPDKPPIIDEIIDVLRASDAILVGGSLGVTPYDIDDLIRRLRASGYRKPIILFPGGLNNIAKEADAILFMSLLNSDDPYWIIGAQVSAAPLIHRLGIEPLPSAYVIVGEGGAAGHVGRARPVPFDKPDVLAAYVLAAKYLGMKFVYLEAGSGARRSIPPESISTARRIAGNDVYIIVGGGIRDSETALALLRSGADAVVVGTLVEKNPKAAAEIGRAIHEEFRCNARQDIYS